MPDAYTAANRTLWNDWLATQRDSDHHHDVAPSQRLFPLLYSLLHHAIALETNPFQGPVKTRMVN